MSHVFTNARQAGDGWEKEAEGEKEGGKGRREERGENHKSKP